MPFYKIRSKTPSWAGEAIGILLLDTAFPILPGNVMNATTYPFPVRYHVVEGATPDRLLYERDPKLLQPFIDACKTLEAQGIRAITGACGFMALFQKQVAEAVNVPVFLSSLLQVPFIASTITSKQKIGIITADATVLTGEHFLNVGITKDIPTVVYGMQDQREFRTSILEQKGTLDSDLMEREICGVADRMVAENPEVAVILLECTELPPFAAAVHARTGLPVFDYITMIKHVHSALVPSRYDGGYII